MKKENGEYKKTLVKQTKGQNWAIRKSLHKETVSGKVTIKRIRKTAVKLNSVLQTPDIIVDKQIKIKIKNLHKLYNGNLKELKKHIKSKPIKQNNNIVDKIQVYELTKGATATRVSLTDKFTRKQLESITDSGIKQILENHLKRYSDTNGKEHFDLAFGIEGIEAMNKNILELNNYKKHKPIHKVRIYEEGSKFAVSENNNSAKSKKYVEAAKGTNLFFAIYWNDEKQKRNFETVPLNEVIQHQKDVAHLPKQERTPIQTKPELGQFLFSLSPNDLVYVPNNEEIENPNLVDFNKLSKEQINRIYKMVSCTGNRSFFIKYEVAQSIVDKSEYSSLNKMERDIIGNMIKNRCWKLKIDRLGNIIDTIRTNNTSSN